MNNSEFAERVEALAEAVMQRYGGLRADMSTGGSLSVMDVCEMLAFRLRREDRIMEILKPFSDVANKDIGSYETNLDLFTPMKQHNRAPQITVGDMRRAAELYEELEDVFR